MALNVKSLLQRTAVAVIGGPGIIYVCYRGGYLLAGVFVLISLLGLREYYNMAGAKGYVPARWAGSFATVGLYAVWQFGGYDLSALVLLLTLVISFVLQINTAGVRNTVENTAVSLFGLFYCTLLPAHSIWFHTRSNVLSVQGGPDGRQWLIMVVLLVWSFDIFAYLVGSLTGKHKLFPTMSPKKSWEGLFGGIVGMGIVFFVLVTVMGLTVLPLDYIVLPVLAGSAALGGDLFESVLKRDTGIKDSSNLIPGHGGILDRFDALFLALPVMYWYIHLSRWVAFGVLG